MNHLESTKSVVSTSFGTAATLVIDTLGYDYASVDVVYGPATSLVSVANTFTLRAADTVAGLADYTATYPVAAATAVATSVAQTSSSTIVRADFDLRGKPRYIELGTTTPDTARRVVIVGRLGKGEIAPEAAASKGVAQKYSG